MPGGHHHGEHRRRPWRRWNSPFPHPAYDRYYGYAYNPWQAYNYYNPYPYYAYAAPAYNYYPYQPVYTNQAPYYYF